MADFNTGTLKGSIQINFGSVREAEKAIKSLQGQFSGYSKTAAKAANSEKARIRALAQVESNLKTLARTQRDQVNITQQSSNAIAQAKASAEAYRNTVEQFGANSVEATRAQVQMKSAVDAANKSVRDSTSNAKANVAAKQQENKRIEALAKSRSQAAREQLKQQRQEEQQRARILKGQTQLAQAEKKLLILKQQSAAETVQGNRALKDASKAVEQYRNALNRTRVSSMELTESYEMMQQRITRASVATTGLNSSTANARSWFRSSRAAASQFGLQLQDVAVQAQMGTNSLVILGQQGSQLLGFFGAGGALAGAILAIGAAIAYVASSAGQAKDATKALTESLEFLDDTLEKTEDGTYRLTQRIVEMAKISKDAAEIELARSFVEASNAFNEAVKAIQSTAADQLDISIFGDIDRAFAQVQKLNAQGRELSNILPNIGTGLSVGLDAAVAETNRLSKEFNITRESAANLIQQISKVQDEASEQNLISLGKTLRGIVINSDDASSSFVKLSSELGGFITKALRSNQLSDEARKLLNDFDKALSDAEESVNSSAKATESGADKIAKYIEQLREETSEVGISEKAIVMHKIARMADSDATYEQIRAAQQQAISLINERNRRQEVIDQQKEQRETLTALVQQYGYASNGVEEYGNQIRLLQEAYRRTGNEELLLVIKRLTEAFAGMGGEAEKVNFQVMEFARTIDGIMNSLDGSFTASLAGLADVFGENISEGMQRGVVGLGAGLDSMMSLMETANRESSTQYKRMAQMQALVAGSLAVAKIWGEYAAQPWIAASLTGLVGANIGAQIAAIESANYANGGMVRGPGTGTSDSIPANLSNGEFVMRAAAVRQIGVANLNAMNQGRMMSFAGGGSTSGTTMVGGDTTVNIIDQRAGGSPVETRERTDENGNKSIEVLIRDLVNNGIVKGDFDRTMGATYGVRRNGRRV